MNFTISWSLSREIILVLSEKENFFNFQRDALFEKRWEEEKRNERVKDKTKVREETERTSTALQVLC